MKLLIADDEVQIREGLAVGIDWQSLGINTVLTAENGLTAFEICRSQHPEIVITDIRMPGIDGLQLSRQIIDLYAPVRVIVLSGYSEFSYAQQSVKIGVSDYLLKPIEIEELENKVRECVEAIAKHRSELSMKQAYSLHHRQSALRKVIHHGQLLQDDDLKMLCAHTGFQDNEACFIAEIGIDDAAEEQHSQILAYIIAMLTELDDLKCSLLYSDPAGLILAFPVYFYQQAVRRLRAWQAELNARLSAQFSTSASIAVSDAQALRLVPMQRNEARLAMHHRIYQGHGSFLLWEEIKLLPGCGDFVPLPHTQLEENVRLLNAEGVDQLLVQYFDQLRKKCITRIEPLQAVCLEMRNLMLSVLREKGFSDQPGQMEQGSMENLPRFVTIDGYEGWARELCRQLFQRVQLVGGQMRSKEVVRAADYILSHYAEDISLEDVAQMVGKSRNYFSSIFKKEMGLSFVDFITQVRVQEAKRMLQTTNDMTYEIAERVGFGDYKYFSKVFKRITGHSPSHYRKQAEN